MFGLGVGTCISVSVCQCISVSVYQCVSVSVYQCISVSVDFVSVDLVSVGLGYCWKKNDVNVSVSDIISMMVMFDGIIYYRV